MAPGIKICPACERRYTGETAQCWFCIIQASPPPQVQPQLTRAERRALDKSKAARERTQAKPDRQVEHRRPEPSPAQQNREKRHRAERAAMEAWRFTPRPPASPHAPQTGHRTRYIALPEAPAAPALSATQLQLRWPPPAVLPRGAPGSGQNTFGSARRNQAAPAGHVQTTGCESLPASAPSLGALARSEGHVRTQRDASGRVVSRAVCVRPSHLDAGRP